MQCTVNQRVRQIIDSENMSINAFSKKIGVLQKTLNEQIKGNNGISLNTIVCILESYPTISAEWLLRGKGDMYISDTTSINIDASGNHIEGNANFVGNGSITADVQPSTELIELRLKCELQEKQILELRNDKEFLTYLLKK